MTILLLLRRKVLSAELYSITYLFVDGVRFIGVVSDGVRILNIKKKPMKLSSYRALWLYNVGTALLTTVTLYTWESG